MRTLGILILLGLLLIGYLHVRHSAPSSYEEPDFIKDDVRYDIPISKLTFHIPNYYLEGTSESERMLHFRDIYHGTCMNRLWWGGCVGNLEVDIRLSNVGPELLTEEYLALVNDKRLGRAWGCNSPQEYSKNSPGRRVGGACNQNFEYQGVNAEIKFLTSRFPLERRDELVAYTRGFLDHYNIVHPRNSTSAYGGP